MTTPIYAANGGSAAGNGLVPYTPQTAMTPAAPELTFNERQTAIIKSQVAPGCTDGELTYFLEVCRATGLNPLLKQIYAIKRKTGDESRMTIQTGIDGYRLLAARTGQLAGIDDPAYDVEDGKHPNRSTVTVYRLIAGQRVPFTATARWREYAALGRDGQPVAMWAKMPWLMLGKCAEALALRRAFPAELSGVYTAEEMAQADNPPTAYVESEHFPATPEKLLNPKRDPSYQRRPYRIEDDPASEHAADMTTAPVPAAKPAAWNAMEDLDVQQALNRLGVRGQQASYAYLKAMRAEMKAQGLVWTPATVDTQLMDRIRQADEAAAAERVDAVTADDTHSLDELDTGIPG